MKLSPFGFAMVTLFCALFFVIAGVDAEDRKQVAEFRQIDADGVVNLMELQAVCVLQDSVLSVMFVSEPEMRPEKYREADLRTDDQIMMFNGKSIKTVEIFDSIYNSLKIGDEIKFGIKRGDMLVMIKFPKADPEEMPVQRVMMVTDDEAAGEDGELQAGGIYKFSGDSENEYLLPEIGLVFEEKDGHAVIKSVLPEAVKFFKDDVPQKGYVLMEINNTKFSTVKELAGIYENVEVGEPVSLKYVFDGYMITTSFAKPKPERDVIIKKKVKE